MERNVLEVFNLGLDAIRAGARDDRGGAHNFAVVDGAGYRFLALASDRDRRFVGALVSDVGFERW